MFCPRYFSFCWVHTCSSNVHRQAAVGKANPNATGEDVLSSRTDHRLWTMSTPTHQDDSSIHTIDRNNYRFMNAVDHNGSCMVSMVTKIPQWDGLDWFIRRLKARKINLGAVSYRPLPQSGYCNVCVCRYSGSLQPCVIILLTWERNPMNNSVQCEVTFTCELWPSFTFTFCINN